MSSLTTTTVTPNSNLLGTTGASFGTSNSTAGSSAAVQSRIYKQSTKTSQPGYYSWEVSNSELRADSEAVDGNSNLNNAINFGIRPPLCSLLGSPNCVAISHDEEDGAYAVVFLSNIARCETTCSTATGTVGSDVDPTTRPGFKWLRAETTGKNYARPVARHGAIMIPYGNSSFIMIGGFALARFTTVSTRTGALTTPVINRGDPLRDVWSGTISFDGGIKVRWTPVNFDTTESTGINNTSYTESASISRSCPEEFASVGTDSAIRDGLSTIAARISSCVGHVSSSGSIPFVSSDLTNPHIYLMKPLGATTTLTARPQDVFIYIARFRLEVTSSSVQPRMSQGIIDLTEFNRSIKGNWPVYGLTTIFGAPLTAGSVIFLTKPVDSVAASSLAEGKKSDTWIMHFNIGADWDPASPSEVDSSTRNFSVDMPARLGACVDRSPTMLLESSIFSTGSWFINGTKNAKVIVWGGTQFARSNGVALRSSSPDTTVYVGTYVEEVVTPSVLNLQRVAAKERKVGHFSWQPLYLKSISGVSAPIDSGMSVSALIYPAETRKVKNSNGAEIGEALTIIFAGGLRDLSNSVAPGPIINGARPGYQVAATTRILRITVPKAQYADSSLGLINGVGCFVHDATSVVDYKSKTISALTGGEQRDTLSSTSLLKTIAPGCSEAIPLSGTISLNGGEIAYKIEPDTVSTQVDAATSSWPNSAIIVVLVVVVISVLMIGAVILMSIVFARSSIRKSQDLALSAAAGAAFQQAQLSPDYY